jgi:hypothetical protein
LTEGNISNVLTASQGPETVEIVTEKKTTNLA